MKKTKISLLFIASLMISLSSCKKEEPEVMNLDSSFDTSIDTTSTSIEDVEIESESVSEDWDKMLDDYEEYVDQYVVLYKKAMKGDNSAITEYPALMEKANELQQSMEKAQNDNNLSPDQITRMTKIQTKMMKAMQ